MCLLPRVWATLISTPALRNSSNNNIIGSAGRHRVRYLGVGV